MDLMITFHAADDRRECWTAGGWCLRDDETPCIPEPDPTASAQARRFWRSTPGDRTQCEIHG